MSTDGSSADVDAVDASLGTQVHFPPRHLVDFVVHYDHTDFYVHKLVLHHHSTYFRTYLDMLTTSSSGSATPFDTPHSCDHSSVPHCIHVPQQTRLIERTPATAADFCLFLCHLYFASHYCYPPFLPKTDIELTTNSVPLTLDFTAVPWIDWSDAIPRLRTTDDELFVLNESLLTLAYYFDCAAMMRQCDAVLLTKVADGEDSEDSTWLTEQCLEWLPYADRYNLHRWKGACCRIIAAHKNVSSLDGYQKARQMWQPALWAAVRAQQ